ncbi:MAG TPA: thiamine pyrophosphate-dependent enzyme, partial [Chloroflexota bacterium]
YSTPVKQHVALHSFADRAQAYGIPSVTVDGNDVIEVYRVTKHAVDQARAGRGPTLIEAQTFRMRGHAEHDDAFYVPKDIIASWERRDPIQLHLAYLEANGLLDVSSKEKIDGRVAGEVASGLEWAEQSSLPDAATQADGVFADPL